MILNPNLGSRPSLVHWAPHSPHQLPAFLQSCPWPLGGPWKKAAAFLLHCRLPWSGSLPSLNVNFRFTGSVSLPLGSYYFPAALQRAKDLFKSRTALWLELCPPRAAWKGSGLFPSPSSESSPCRARLMLGANEVRTCPVTFAAHDGRESKQVSNLSTCADLLGKREGENPAFKDLCAPRALLMKLGHPAPHSLVPRELLQLRGPWSSALVQVQERDGWLHPRWSPEGIVCFLTPVSCRVWRQDPSTTAGLCNASAAEQSQHHAPVLHSPCPLLLPSPCFPQEPYLKVPAFHRPA